MQNDKIYFDLVSNVKSRQDLDKLVLDLDNLETALYKTDKSAYQSALSLFPASVSDYFKSVPEGQLDNKLREIKEKIANIQAVKIRIAFKPSDKFIEELGNLMEGSIVEFDYDPSIPAGAVIEKSGKYIDLSLKI